MSVYATLRRTLGIGLLGRSIGRVSTIFIHTEAGATMPVGSTLAQERQRMRAINNFHRSLGWSGYGYCVDEETQIFTKDGWKSYFDLSVGDIALTLNNNTGQAEWQPVEAVNVFSEQSRVMLSLEGRAHSSLTTLNHRWPVEKYRNDRVTDKDGRRKSVGIRYERDFTTSSEFNFNDRILRSAPVLLNSEQKYSDDFVELVAWFYTEGEIKKHTKGHYSGRVNIYQSYDVNPVNVDRIRHCLQGVFGNPCIKQLPQNTETPAWRERHRSDRPGRVEFYLNPLAGNELTTVAPNKVPSVGFLSELTTAQLELFIKISLDGDGNGSDRFSFDQRDYARAEAFANACILSGRSVNICYNSYDMWCVFVPDGSEKEGSRVSPLHIENKDVVFSGKVWCPTMPNGTWLAKRNGTVYFTGNSAGINPRSHLGRVHEGRGFGRSGAHTQRYNSTSLAICCLGHGDRHGITNGAIQGIREWIGYGIDKGFIAPNPRIRGHREVAPKSCPGNLIYPQIGRLRGVTGREPKTSTPPPKPEPEIDEYIKEYIMKRGQSDDKDFDGAPVIKDFQESLNRFHVDTADMPIRDEFKDLKGVEVLDDLDGGKYSAHGVTQRHLSADGVFGRSTQRAVWSAIMRSGHILGYSVPGRHDAVQHNVVTPTVISYIGSAHMIYRDKYR